MAKESDPAFRTFISYIDKSREFFAAQGFADPYRWARFDQVPFAPPTKPLSDCTVTLITTASLPPEAGSQHARPGAVFTMSSEQPPPWLYTNNRFWDKLATHTDDLDSFFPIHRLQEASAEGLFRLAPRCIGVPTEYSHRLTTNEDAPAVLDLCREDGVDAAILVPL